MSKDYLANYLNGGLFSIVPLADFRFTAVPHFTKCQLIFCIPCGQLFEKELGSFFQKSPDPFRHPPIAGRFPWDERRVSLVNFLDNGPI
ncbi:hypothetical protein T265_07733 [Opisthorchis viverrini]|uniref:Uncharacterized protein n=1 Tax=Opisthorchis viverrini TaxID=6198 RepID=A0A074ZMP9_OPIVI|nr:hypothetical protein T265_07733 [Opisthorchis viverrini]KER24635.1 hypothetical protein T265_07733 [Opisthorchis viverrini]